MGIFDNPTPEDEAVYAQEAAMIDASELIAVALERSGTSRAQLAKDLGISRSEVTARLAGERNITVRKLAQTLHSMGMRLELNASPIKEAEQPVAHDPWVTHWGIAIAHEHSSAGRQRALTSNPAVAWKTAAK